MRSPLLVVRSNPERLRPFKIDPSIFNAHVLSLIERRAPVTLSRRAATSHLISAFFLPELYEASRLDCEIEIGRRSHPHSPCPPSLSSPHPSIRPCPVFPGDALIALSHASSHSVLPKPHCRASPCRESPSLSQSPIFPGDPPHPPLLPTSVAPLPTSLLISKQVALSGSDPSPPVAAIPLRLRPSPIRQQRFLFGCDPHPSGSDGSSLAVTLTCPAAMVAPLRQ